MTDQSERAVEVLERALAAVGDTDARLAVRLEASAAMAGMTDERTAPAAIRRAEGLHRRLRTLTYPPMNLLVMLAYDAARANRADEAQELAERALACEPYPPPLWTTNPLMNTLMLVECYDALQELCEDVLKSARHRGAMQELAGISVWRAGASYDCGALADAEADARWALEHAAGVHRIRAVADLIRVLIERDELQEAEDVLKQFVDPRGSRSIEVPRFLFARGQLRRAQGRLQEALDDFLECGQRYDRLRQSRRSSVQWSEVALAHAAVGSAGEARRLAGEQLALARAAVRPRMLGISLRVCGLVEGGDTGLELLAEAVKTLERSRSPLELARALLDYGAALRRAGRRVQARAERERSSRSRPSLRPPRIAARARVELIAAGAKPRRDAITGRDALTAGELRVARLAAEGLTNREIAQALFITTKTAKGHLSRVYHKLGITRRGRLPGALGGPLDNTGKDWPTRWRVLRVCAPATGRYVGGNAGFIEPAPERYVGGCAGWIAPLERVARAPKAELGRTPEAHVQRRAPRAGSRTRGMSVIAQRRCPVAPNVDRAVVRNRPFSLYGVSRSQGRITA